MPSTFGVSVIDSEFLRVLLVGVDTNN